MSNLNFINFSALPARIDPAANSRTIYKAMTGRRKLANARPSGVQLKSQIKKRLAKLQEELWSLNSILNFKYETYFVTYKTIKTWALAEIAEKLELLKEERLTNEKLKKAGDMYVLNQYLNGMKESLDEFIAARDQAEAKASDADTKAIHMRAKEQAASMIATLERLLVNF